MSDWITYQDVLSSKFMLVRKSHVAPQYVEAFSIDNGRTEVMADTEAGVRAVLAQAIQTGTYRESGHVLAGPYFYKLRKNAGLNNSRHWINRVTAMLFPSGATADAAWVRAFQTSPNGSLASDYSVSIGNDVSQVTVPKWNDNIFPDGVCVSVKSFRQPGTFVLILPEQTNYRATSSNAYFETVPQDAWSPIRSLGVPDAPLNWPGTGEQMAAWCFSMARHPTQQGRHIGCFHLERHPHSQAPPCYKAIAIATTDDEGLTWSLPQLALTYPVYTPALHDTWSGIGDCSSLVWLEGSKRWLLYCYTAQNGGGITVASSTSPDAAPGSWKFLRNGQFTIDALSGSMYDTILRQMSCGNPWVGWCVPLGGLLAMGSPWGRSNVLCFATSSDGVNWSTPKEVAFDSPPGVTPVYPSLVGDGGSEWIGNRARIYYADSRPDGKRRMKVRTMTITRNG